MKTNELKNKILETANRLEALGNVKEANEIRARVFLLTWYSNTVGASVERTPAVIVEVK